MDIRAYGLLMFIFSLISVATHIILKYTNIMQRLLSFQETPNVAMDFNFPLYDDHKEGHTTVTAPQLALMYIWAGALVLWIWQQSNRKPQQPEAEENRYTQNDSSQSNGSKVTDTVDETKENLQNDNREQDSTTGSATDPEANIGNGGNKSCDDDRQGSGVRQMSSVRQFTAVKPPPDLQSFLVSLLQLGFIMFFFFLSDYVKVIILGDQE